MLPPAMGYAQVSNNIPTNDYSYALIDKLAAVGLIKTPITAQRPWTRDYAARLVTEAMSNRDELIKGLESPDRPERGDYKSYNKLLAQKRFVDAILKELSAKYGDGLHVIASPKGEAIPCDQLHYNDIQFHPLSSASLTYTYLNNSPLPVGAAPPNRINDQFYPLAANQEGRHYEEGSNYYIETESSLTFPKYFSAYLRPQFQFIYTSTSAGDEAHAYIQNLYVKTGINSFEIEVGRDQLVWGNALHGGLMFSDNPRPLDMVKLSTSKPVKILVPVEATLIAANMGPSYDPEDAWVWGGKINVSPFEWLDLGFADITESKAGHSSVNRIGFDGKLVLNGLRGVNLYGEGYIENRDDEKFGWLAGVYFPRFDFIGKWSLRVEYENIAANTYTSSKYPSGWALNNLFIGSIMGPDSQKFTASADYNFTPQTKLGLAGGYMERKGVNNESHIFNAYTFAIPFQDNRLNFYSSLGWDYVTNSNFTSGNNKADLMFQAGLKMNFPEF